MCMSDKLKEEIKYYTEWLRILLIWVFSLITGLVSIMFKKEIPNNELLIMAYVGIFCLSFIIFVLCLSISSKLKKL